MPRIELGIGGGAYLSAPLFLASFFLLFTKLLTVRWFDTAQAYGDGRGETALGYVLGDKEHVITKWGLSSTWRSDSTGSARWSSAEFSPDQLRNAVDKSRKRLAHTANVFFVLHCAEENFVQLHIQELRNLRDEHMVTGIGYSVNEASALFQENSWADLIETPLAGLEKLVKFEGTIAVHGVFRSKASDRLLFQTLSKMNASRVIILSGTWRPWRLVGNFFQVKRLNEALNAKGGKSAGIL